MQINQTSPSFTSNFKFTNNIKNDVVALEMQFMHEGNPQYYEQNINDLEQLKKGHFSNVYFAIDDKFDKKIETLLKNNGVKYTKRNYKDVLNKDNIFSRIVLGPYDTNRKKLAVIDMRKLEDAFQKSITYIAPNVDNMYDIDLFEKFKNFLKLDCPIYASSLVLNEYDNQPCADFIDGRHRFRVLYEMGLEKIPVALSDTSIEIAKKFKMLV